MQLVIARPSPFARKARVALIEKGLPFESVMDVPWNADTVATDSNPLGKIPILILDDGTVIHDSKVIVEYLETLDREPRLLPAEPKARIAHKQIEALADGVCDAVVLIFLERQRPPEMRSRDWIARQRSKIDAGVAELARMLGDRTWFVGDGLGLGDITVGCMLGYLDLRFPEFDWRGPHPNLVALFERLSARPSFQQTIPEPQVVPLLG